MAISEKLNESWTTQDSMSAVFEVRALLENLYNVALETKNSVAAITAGAKFTSVDTEIKQSGVALVGMVNTLVNAMSAHSDFLNWKQP